MVQPSILANYTSHFASVNGIHLHYHRSTPVKDRPTVVLVHGITDNGLCWVQMAEALRPRYNVVMPDQRGHGLSDKPAKGYTIDILAADIAGLIDALTLDHPAIMGQSLGGAVVLATAALFPEMMQCVILEEPALVARDETPEERLARTQSWREEYTSNQKLSRPELMVKIRQEVPTWDELILGPTVDAKRELSVEAMLQIGNENRWGSWRAYLPKIRRPVLLLASDPSLEAMMTPEIIQEIMGLWSNGRVVRFQGAGHCLHQELFEPCLQAVNEFLDEIFTATPNR